jgi:hypothetical protein
VAKITCRLQSLAVRMWLARAVRVDEAGRLERPASGEGAGLEGGAVGEGGLEFGGQHLIRTATVRQGVNYFVVRPRGSVDHVICDCK